MKILIFFAVTALLREGAARSYNGGYPLVGDGSDGGWPRYGQYTAYIARSAPQKRAVAYATAVQSPASAISSGSSSHYVIHSHQLSKRSAEMQLQPKSSAIEHLSELTHSQAPVNLRAQRSYKEGSLSGSLHGEARVLVKRAASLESPGTVAALPGMPHGLVRTQRSIGEKNLAGSMRGQPVPLHPQPYEGQLLTSALDAAQSEF